MARSLDEFEHKAGGADYIGALGRAFTAHRLKRAADLWREGYGEWLAEIGVITPSRGLSTMLLLTQGARAVTEIAGTIGFSHPFATKLLADLQSVGLVALETDQTDRRRKLAVLTPKGRADVDRIQTATDVIARAFEDLAASADVDLETIIGRLEQAERDEPFAGRIRRMAGIIKSGEKK